MMKPQGIETPLRKLYKSQKITLQIATAIILFITIIPLFLKTYSSSSSFSSSSSSEVPKDDEISEIAAASSTTEGSGGGSGLRCDIFAGEWVPNPEAPYYTNTSCWVIQDQQNCMKYGRPDTEFMRWRWKPYGCDLPNFNPSQFLEIVRGKSMAFVGDSVGRNQMQSLICLLSRVEYPQDVSYTTDDRFKRFQFKIHNFTVASFWSPFLVKSKEHDPNDTTGTNLYSLYSLYLDEFDESWTTQIEEFDYLIVSDGHWFFRQLIYRHNGCMIGCHLCTVHNLTNYPASYGYRLAFRTAFRAILSREKFKGITYLRTFSPGHFEGGEWNRGGNCLRKRPFESNEAILESVYVDMYNAQIEELRAAEKKGRERGLKFRLIDATHAMLLRPDGHPSSYGHWHSVTKFNDCVHWCLPGPIDIWNDFLLNMMKME